MKTQDLKPIEILMADDDEDDRLMMLKAMKENNFSNELRFVSDGEELLDYLLLKGNYTKEKAPTPDLILLDLNMPKKNGREALQEIKSNKKLKIIPVVIFTTSKAEEDIITSYELCANSFITKPSTFEGLRKVIQEINKYWFDLVELPRIKKLG